MELGVESWALILSVLQKRHTIQCTDTVSMHMLMTSQHRIGKAPHVHTSFLASMPTKPQPRGCWSGNKKLVFSVIAKSRKIGGVCQGMEYEFPAKATAQIILGAKLLGFIFPIGLQRHGYSIHEFLDCVGCIAKWPVLCSRPSELR